MINCTRKRQDNTEMDGCDINSCRCGRILKMPLFFSRRGVGVKQANYLIACFDLLRAKLGLAKEPPDHEVGTDKKEPFVAKAPLIHIRN